MDPTKDESSSSKSIIEPPKKIKQYHCCYCNRAFSRSEHRSRHERSHTKERPFHCEKCPSTFVRRDLLLRHDRTVHAKQSKSVKISKQSPKSSNMDQSPQKLKNQKKPKSKQASSIPSPNTTLESVATNIPENVPFKPPSNNIDFLVPPTTKHQHRKTSFDLFSLLNNDEDSNHPSFNLRKRSNTVPNSQSQTPSTSLPINNAADINAAFLMTKLQHSFFADSNQSSNPPPDQSPSTVHNTPTTHQPPATHHNPPSVPQINSSFPYNTITHYFSDQRSRAPSRLLLNRYLIAFFLQSQPHLPFLHPQSFDLNTAHPALLFGVCSIGALICNEYEMSQTLQRISRTLVAQHIQLQNQPSSPPKPCTVSPVPLWPLQTLLTLIIDIIWAGDFSELEYIVSVFPFLSSQLKVHIDNLPTLSNTHFGKSEYPSPSASFIQTELAIRAYFSTFILSTALVQIFDHRPTFLSTDILRNIPFPCDESFWNSLDLDAATVTVPHRLTFGQALDALASGNIDSFSHSASSPMTLRILAASVTNDICLENSQPCNNYKALYSSSQHTQMTMGLWQLLKQKADSTTDGQNNLLVQGAFSLSLALNADPCFFPPQSSILLNIIRSESHPLILRVYFSLILNRIRLLVDISQARNSVRFQASKSVASSLLENMDSLISHKQLSGPAVCGLVFTCSEFLRLIMVSGTQLSDNLVTGLTNYPDSLWAYFEMTVIVVMWCYRYENESKKRRLSDETQNRARDNMMDKDELHSDDQVYEILYKTAIEAGVKQVQGSVALTLGNVAVETFSRSSTSALASFFSLALKSFTAHLQSALNWSPSVSNEAVLSTPSNYSLIPGSGTNTKNSDANSLFKTQDSRTFDQSLSGKYNNNQPHYAQSAPPSGPARSVNTFIPKLEMNAGDRFYTTETTSPVHFQNPKMPISAPPSSTHLHQPEPPSSIHLHKSVSPILPVPSLLSNDLRTDHLHKQQQLPDLNSMLGGKPHYQTDTDPSQFPKPCAADIATYNSTFRNANGCRAKFETGRGSIRVGGGRDLEKGV